MKFSTNKRIKVHLADGTDRSDMVVSEIRIEDGIVSFGRDDGRGWRPFMSVPMSSIISWDYD